MRSLFFLSGWTEFKQIFLRHESRHQPHDHGCQQKTNPECYEEQHHGINPALGQKTRDNRPQEKEQRTVDAQRHDRVTPQIGDDAGAFDLFAEQHDGENPREGRDIDLEDVPRIIIGAHAQRRSREVHRNDRQHDKQRDQLVEAMVRIKEKVVPANPEPREIERQGRQGHIEVKRQFDTLFAAPEARSAQQQNHCEHHQDVSVAQVVDQVEEDVAVEKSDQEPDRRVEADQLVSLEHQQQFAQAHRQAECPGQDFRNAVHQQERTEVKDQKGNEQFICFPDEKAAEALVGFEEKPRDEEIERHGETRQGGTAGKRVERAADMHHDDQYDTETFGEVNEIYAPAELFFHRRKDSLFGPKWILPGKFSRNNAHELPGKTVSTRTREG